MASSPLTIDQLYQLISNVILNNKLAVVSISLSRKNQIITVEANTSSKDVLAKIDDSRIKITYLDNESYIENQSLNNLDNRL